MKNLSLPAAISGTLAPTHGASAPYVFRAESMALLKPADRLKFETWGQGPHLAPRHALLHQAFEEQVRQQPDTVAITHLGRSIRYLELERQANRLAMELSSMGVRRGDQVALFVQRSIEMVVGILACLKLGAAYVPQCVGIAPKAQQAHVLHATQARVVLTLSRLLDEVALAAPGRAPLPHIAVDHFMAQPFSAGSAYECFVAAAPVQTDDLCFVLFTSGTTGTPNGVQVSHRNVANIVLTSPGNLGLRPGMKVAQLLNIGFDMAAWEVLGALTHGATLVIRGSNFQEVAEQVDVIIATPSILAGIEASRCRQVQVVALAGEPCPKPLADKWAAQCRFYNACGPTEVTIVNTMQHYTPQAKALTIGRPTPNNTVYVLNQDLQPCAIGEVGEMWGGGDCVTRGYMANPELTAQRYRADPFLGEGRLMFRTRDLGRWTADGQLEHLGRLDDQVKVRGFRVELDAVSHVMEAVPGCEKAVTLKLNDQELVSFVSPMEVDVRVARAAVATALPYYCVPALLIAMPSLPITGRGKVDKQALLALAQSAVAAGLTPTQTPAPLQELAA